VPYQLLADLVLATHVAVVMFVIGGLAAIIIGNCSLRCSTADIHVRVGNFRGWGFVNGWWFRAAHLAAIAVVAAQAWLGVTCPLTTLESALRVKAGGTGYEASFIEYWLTRLLYYDAPAWVFTATYTLFGLAVAAAWWRFPPRRSLSPQE
jgi:polyferredoxin